MEIFLIGILIIVFSAILHEIAHGFVADKLGDPTARIAGRLTLNPIPHIDPIMSILVPLLLISSGSPIIFGGAKPVPVNPLMLREGRKDIALVALAGPATNLIIAILAALLAHFVYNLSLTLFQILQLVVRFNLILGFLNLIPIPPLDGSKFFSILMPEKVAQQYFALAPFGILILFLLLLTTPTGEILSQLVATSLRMLGM